MKTTDEVGTAMVPDLAFAPGCCRPAVVGRVHGARRLRLRRLGRVTEARVAVPGYDDPREGDLVLGLTDDDGDTWVTGVIRAPRPATLVEQTLAASAPTEVRDEQGRLLFEYDPARKHAVLHMPSGDLQLSVPGGALRLHARDGVSLESEGDVHVRGDRRVSFESSRPGAEARISLEPGEVHVAAAVVATLADRAELLAARVTVRARSLDSHVARVRSVAKSVEMRAGRIVERAKTSYREVSGLSQTRAGRLRLVARTAAQLVGENTLLKARDRMKVRGERIHLA